MVTTTGVPAAAVTFTGSGGGGGGVGIAAGVGIGAGAAAGAAFEAIPGAGAGAGAGEPAGAGAAAGTGAVAGAAASGLELAVGEAAGADAGVELLHPPKNNVAEKTTPAVNDKDPKRMTLSPCVASIENNLLASCSLPQPQPTSPSLQRRRIFQRNPQAGTKLNNSRFMKPK
jgi:hypothetical protein